MGRVAQPLSPGVTQVHLLVKIHENLAAASASPPVFWENTSNALALYKELGFRNRDESDIVMYPNYDETCQRYMVVDLSGLEAKLSTMVAPLKGYARWVGSSKCRLTNRTGDRPYYESDAVAAMTTEHDEANGGDGAKVEQLIP